MIKELLIAIVLVVGIPAGYLLAYLCKEELVPGRKWFLAIVIISLISGIIFLFFDTTWGLTSFFITIVSLISFWKSFDKKFLKK